MFKCKAKGGVSTMISTLTDLFREKYKLLSANEIAVIDKENKISYSSLFSYVGYIQEVINLNVKDSFQKVIAFQFENSIEFVATYIAIVSLGAIAHPLYYEYEEDEIEQIFIDSKPILFISNKKVKSLPEKINMTSISCYYSFFKNVIAIPTPKFSTRIKKNDIAVYLNSSGTTGTSKIIAHTHYSLFTNVVMHTRSVGLSTNDIGIAVLPLSFGYSHLTQLLSHIYVEGSIVVGDTLKFIPILLRNIKQFHVTDITIVPSYLITIIDYMKRKGKNFREYDSLRLILFGGGTLAEEKYNLLRSLVSEYTSIIQTYGMTECGPRITSKLIESKYDKFNLGSPLNGITIDIMNPDKNGFGEIVIDTPSKMKGYVHNGKIINETSSSFRSNDLGKLNRSGELIFKTRIGNIIKQNGFNIYIEEVEEMIRHIFENNHLDLDIRLYSPGDEKLFLEVCGQNNYSSVSKEAILELLFELPINIRITKLIFVSEIIRTPSGKVQRTNYNYKNKNGVWDGN